MSNPTEIPSQSQTSESTIREKAAELVRTLGQHIRSQNLTYHSYSHATEQSRQQHGGHPITGVDICEVTPNSVGIHASYWDGADYSSVPLGGLISQGELQAFAEQAFGMPVTVSPDCKTIVVL